MKIGYVRSATLDQQLEQTEVLKRYDVDKIFEDYTYSINNDRVQFEKMLMFIRRGDTIYVPSLDSIARGTTELLYIIEDLKEEGISLIIIKEGIDTSSKTIHHVLAILRSLSELELRNIVERQRIGIEIPRKEVLTDLEDESWSEYMSSVIDSFQPSVDRINKSGILDTLEVTIRTE